VIAWQIKGAILPKNAAALSPKPMKGVKAVWHNRWQQAYHAPLLGKY